MSTNRAVAAVAVDNVSKSFRVPAERVHTLKETALHPLRRTTYEEFVALKGISFDVAHGEFLGIVGRNGSGKSTLLKCMAGIYRVDTGGIYVDGRLSAFIELGVGFNPDLPARDNVLINGTMLGLSPREARRRYDSVIDFAELREFEQLKIKNYSSGMLVRLAFAVMIHVDAEILLVDEVLAVGDAAFQQKCFDEFYRLKDENRTVILVTHDMGAVERFCDRAVLFDHGDMVSEGDPHRVGVEYLELNFGKPKPIVAAEGADGIDADRSGVGGAEIVEAWFEDQHGARASMLELEHGCRFAARVRFSEAIDHPVFGVTLENAAHDNVFSASTQWQEAETGHFAAGEEAIFRVQFINVLAPGRYDATPVVSQRGSGTAVMDRRERFISTVVSGTHASGALLELPYAAGVERTTVQPTAEIES
ncbi:ABC transporter ATP-binding protein [Conexibacter sp. CPCC 206217]|uniref:ABC transporter ATP-binding protein n=1 Tax=Conexibacter sp. CPCC 206217 TaxID=3064574 RepID=UPI002724B68C|nr:ABC transporter ATP-binding protein [Conexibacter sp. CPCC 206217]MDO8209996.1 ABC transporter ATP-binding protein [Conexibacter sp. CPCC 206217]